ncbi:TetR family transcriptional regulator [Alicyclobacillus sp. SO9]|uniref:acyl-CoA-like ligand-binding transcription factor n=1 Tax=Alicyclobacillus sp. SO9 TaxID=2665646 RepID=UPI001E34A9CB|nr:TetR family transcriptional regulator [Alicyclobacillus sp. SO9]
MEQAKQQQMGLRDRKKLKTRMSIQQHAMKLFKKQGYTETTVEQIAEAAEISPSTFFRYFPTKESVVLTDFYDPVIMETFVSQPKDLPPIEALRNGMRDAFAAMSSDEQTSEMERTKLIMSVPELRAAILSNFLDIFGLLNQALAKRTDRSSDDSEVRMFTGAFFGVALAAGVMWMEDPERDMLEMIDDAIEYLKKGVPLD